jgi:hypothetical protein
MWMWRYLVVGIAIAFLMNARWEHALLLACVCALSLLEEPPITPPSRDGSE